MRFDVFVAHAAEDTEAAEALYERLTRRGLRVFLDTKSPPATEGGRGPARLGAGRVDGHCGAHVQARQPQLLRPERGRCRGRPGHAAEGRQAGRARAARRGQRPRAGRAAPRPERVGGRRLGPRGRHDHRPVRAGRRRGAHPRGAEGLVDPSAAAAEGDGGPPRAPRQARRRRGRARAGARRARRDGRLDGRSPLRLAPPPGQRRRHRVVGPRRRPAHAGARPRRPRPPDRRADRRARRRSRRHRRRGPAGDRARAVDPRARRCHEPPGHRALAPRRRHRAGRHHQPRHGLGGPRRPAHRRAVRSGQFGRVPERAHRRCQPRRGRRRHRARAGGRPPRWPAPCAWSRPDR